MSVEFLIMSLSLIVNSICFNKYTITFVCFLLLTCNTYKVTNYKVSSTTIHNTNNKVSTNKTCVSNALKKLMPLLMRLQKLIAQQFYNCKLEPTVHSHMATNVHTPYQQGQFCHVSLVLCQTVQDFVTSVTC